LLDSLLQEKPPLKLIMDPEALANTLINAAQSMLSQNQQQQYPQKQQQGFGDFRESQMQGGGYSQGYGNQMSGGNGWRGNDRRDYQRDDRRNDRRDYRDRSDDRRNDRRYGGRDGGNDWSGGGNQMGKRDMYQARSFRGGVGKGFGSTGNRREKNYREKIKPENGPPNYRGDDYAHLETELLSCKICKKVMWHNISFAKHIRGKAHEEELDKLVAADNDMIKELREQIAVVESMKDEATTEKCAMCDCEVAGTVEEHRKSHHHRQLRKFMHPTCEMCIADFDGRSEWYYHCYSAEHVSILQGFGGNDKSGVLAREDIGRLVRELGGQPSEGGSFWKKYNDGRASYLKKLKEEEEEDNIKKLEEQIDPSLPGAGHLMATKGFFCSLCNHFFTKEDSTVSYHCNSEGHKDKEQALIADTAENY